MTDYSPEADSEYRDPIREMYEQAKRDAERTGRPFEDVLIEANWY